MTSTAAPPKAGHFDFLDALRGLAALWVVFFHLTVSDTLPAVEDDGGVADFVWNEVFGLGYVGVAMFFVLSGFVICHSLRRGLDTGPDVRTFMIRRVIRLTPPYYAAIVLAIVVHAFAVTINDKPFEPGGQPLGVGQLISHLFYLQGILDFGYVNDVFWTLTIEMQFYLVLAAFLVLAGYVARRHEQGFRAMVWLGATLSIGGALTDLHPQITFVPVFYSFFLGSMIYWVWAERLHMVELAVYMAALAVVFAIEPDAFISTSLITGVMIIVAGQIGSGLSTWLSAPSFKFLGKISYSLYLVHVPIQGAALDVVVKALGTGTAAVFVAVVVSTVACIVASWMFWWAIERPSIAWGAALKKKSPTPPSTGASTPATGMQSTPR